MKITNLKLNGITNPIGFLYDSLLCSWKVVDTAAKTQKNAKIEVATAADFSDACVVAEGDLASNETEIKVDLKPYTTYYWRVTVEAENGESATSETAVFETAKMDESWSGKWISISEADTAENIQPVFVKNITSSTAVKRARLYICGLGMFEAYMDGTKIGNEFLTPLLNDYEDCFQYMTYDVTEALSGAGEHELSVMLGDGWYKSVFGLDLQPNHFGDRLALIAELRIEYEDGSVEVIGTDDSWNYKGSDVEKSGIYFGEIFNRELYKNKENPLRAAVEIAAPKHGKLVARYSLPVIIKETIAAKEIIHTPAGETVIDFGQNHAGIMSFNADFPAGTRVTFETAEILQEGNFYHDNYRDAEALFTYVSDGRKEEVRPHFTYYGYRYLKVTGWPGELKLSDVTANVMYSDMERIGYIETSNEKINRLYANCIWGQKSNFLDVPTDCPQRSERLGWTGDIQAFSPTASLNMDTRAFFHKYFKDIYSDQMRANGAVASFIPSFGQVGGAAIWADVATMTPDNLYKIYGNLKQIELHYDMMKQWVEWMYRKDEKDEGGARRCAARFTFGDWLALDGITDQSMKGGTDDAYLSHAYYYRSTRVTAEMAERLGKTEDAAKYGKLADEIKEAFIAEYFTPTGRFAMNTQAAFIVALRFGLYKDRERLVKEFRDRLYKDCFEIRCGFAGAPLLCLTLCENGMEDIAYQFLFKENFPSWLYCVNLGATTIWERWNSLLPDGTCSGTGMNSFNHYAYGSVVEFIYTYIGGLRPAEAGYRKAVIAPLPSMHFTFFKSSIDTACGKYVSNWEIKKDGTFVMNVEVPFNCTAEVTFPRYQGEKIAGAENLTVSEDGKAMLCAGCYEFSYQPKNDFRMMYGPMTRLGQLADDERALGILQETLPNAFGMIMGRDKESMNLELGDLWYRDYMGFNRENVGAATEKLYALDCYGRY